MGQMPYDKDPGDEPGSPSGHDWGFSSNAHLSYGYRREDPKLDALFNKAKASQWDAGRDIDWSVELDEDNPLGMHDGTLLVFGTPVWDALDSRGRCEVRRHTQAWMVSQILHGEQAALLCASKLAMIETSLAAKLCNAMQVADEARHVEVFTRLSKNMGIDYPMTRSLESLLRDTVASNQADIINLGMQILIEGIALSIFTTTVAYSNAPFVKDLFNRVKADEARHFAVGRITLKRIAGELSEAELRVRDEFICEGAYALYEHLCAEDIWEAVELPGGQSKKMIRDAPKAEIMRRSLFRRLVPSVRDMGFLRPRVVSAFEKLGIMGYSEFPAFHDA